jgi:hypothetical protein
MKIILCTVHVSIIGYCLYHFFSRQPHQLRKLYIASAGLKLFAGITFGLIYHYYYTIGDTLQYFHDASLITEWGRHDLTQYFRFLWDHENYPDILNKFDSSDRPSLFFTKITSILNMLTGDNYWIDNVYLSVVSFFGTWYLFRKIASWFPAKQTAAFIALLAFPSVVFWSSGLSKESVALSALFYLAGLFLEYWCSEKIALKNLVPGVVAVLLLWTLKYYYAAVLIPVIFSCVAFRFIQRSLNVTNHFVQVTLWMAIFSVLLTSASFLHPNFSFGIFFEVLVSNNEAYNKLSPADDLIAYHNLSPETGSILLNTPLALVSGLFRPFIFEAGNAFQIIAGIENLVILAIVILSLKNVSLMWKSEHRILILAMLVFVFVLCVLLALSTPNFGTLSRYRIGYLPFFLLLVLTDNPVVTWIERSILRLVR